MDRFWKVGALAVATLPLHLLMILAVMGVPRPPAVSVENVGRVGWGPVLASAGDLWEARTSRSFAAFLPGHRGVLVWGRHRVLEPRLFEVPAPDSDPALVRSLPRNVSGLHVSPDRDYAIVSWDRDGDEQHRLYRWDLDGAEPVAITPSPERASFGAFEPGGPRIAYTSTRRNGRDFDVYIVDPTAPDSDRRVFEADGMWAVTGWSPSGSQLLLAEIVSNVTNRLHLLHLGTGELQSIGPGTEQEALHSAPRWSADGSSLFYASNRGTEFMHLRRFDFGTQEETTLLGDISWDVSSVQISHDGSFLLVSVNDDGRTVYYTTDPDGRESASYEPFPAGSFGAVLHPDAPQVAVTHVDAAGRSRTFVHDLEKGTLIQWAGPRGPRSQDPSAREARLERYPTFDMADGEPRRISAFVYPGRGEGPRPVLIDIHGGPEAQARLRTGESSLQRAGITVITPNVRGSTGYGKTFASLDDQYLREDAVRDIGALLDWIAEQPDMDPDRVAVIGGSYGGYMVLASLVHYSPRLTCGIDVVGVSNFVTFLENTADYRRDLRRAEYGDERIPEMRAFLESISPLNHAERIASRLMVVQGANDPRVPVGESRQLVDRVRTNGLDVAYMEGENEGHGFRHPWNAFYANVAQQERLRECLSAG